MPRSSIDGNMGGCIPVFFHRAFTLEVQYHRWHKRQGGRYYVLMLNLRR